METHEVQVQNNSTQLVEREELLQFEPSLAHNKTWQQSHTVTPTMTGERLRLTYLLAVARHRRRRQPITRTANFTAR